MKKSQMHPLFYWFLYVVIGLVLIILFPYVKRTFAFIGSVLLPFVIASFIAYILHPLVEWIHQQQIHKGIAIFLIYMLFLSSTSYGMYLLYPRVLVQLNEFNEQLPTYIHMYEQFMQHIDDSAASFPGPVHTAIDQLIMNVESSVERAVHKTIGGLTKIVDFMFVLMLIPVLVFYYLKDFTSIKTYMRSKIPQHFRETVKGLVDSVDDRLGKYIRGQFLVSLFVTITSWIAYKWIGIDFALLLAIGMGIANVIPYFGPIIGAVPAVLITITTSTHLVWFVIGSIILIQIIESNILSPFILGKSVQIHPIVILFILVVGGKLFGIIGMMLAVPVLTIILACTHYIKTYLQSVSN
ncbi:MAG TPA: AI-2E family transporter [Bacillota bacterium]|nr:AI-2E family transporter [Bacillota bacterium]